MAPCEVGAVHLLICEHCGASRNSQRGAGFFFRVLQNNLFDGLLLHLCRLTDQPVMSRRKNMTLGSLVPLIDRPELRREVEDLVKTAREKTEFARTLRNRMIAHRDLETARSPELPGGTLRDVRSALKSIDDVLNRIELEYEDSSCNYDLPIVDPGDAEALVACLQRGLTAQREDDERLLRTKSG
jgi:hypothetical protein